MDESVRQNAERRGDPEHSGDATPQRSIEKDLSGVFRRVTVRDPARQPPSSPVHKERQMTMGANSIRGPADAFSKSGELYQNDAPGFTEMFQSLAGQDRSGGAGEIRLEHNQPTVRSSDSEHRMPLTGGQGEFTRLFQRLDGQDQGAVSHEQSDQYGNSVQLNTRDSQGGFTQLLRTLSNASDEELPPHAPAPVAYASTEGPGEFTRIVSRSALREATNREEQRGIPIAAVPAEPRPNPPASFAAPGLMVPGLQSPPIVAGPPMNPPVGQIVSSVPSIPAPPAPAVPHPQSTSWLQQNLPMLLIANLVAMLLVIILVVFMLLRAH